MRSAIGLVARRIALAGLDRYERSRYGLGWLDGSDDRRPHHHDRPEDIVRAVGSALASARHRFEVVVVDQGDADDARLALRLYENDPRPRHLKMQRLGLSAALNRGTEDTQADLIALTGDDCVVCPDWLERLTDAFAPDPRVAVVFGHVGSAPFDPELGFVPGCVIERDFVATSIEDLHRMAGTTACMAYRRSLWRELGGFDEILGVGAPMLAGEDLDFALRALAAGYSVRQTPNVRVEHQSPVLWADRASLTRRNWYGTGAAMAKTLKLAPRPMFVGLRRLVGRWRSAESGVAATYGARPDRSAMLSGFVAGFVVGFVTPVDRRRGMFAPSRRRMAAPN